MSSTIPYNSTMLVIARNSIEIANSSRTAIYAIFGFYYACVFLTGIIGNSLIIAAVFRFKHMKSVVNGFLMNLAMADMLCAFLSIFNVVSFYFQSWMFGEILCKAQSTMVIVSFTISVLTLVAVALERYISICYPHKSKRTYKQSLYISGVIWVLSFAFCSPLTYGYKTHIERDGKITCSPGHWLGKSKLIFYGIHSVVIYLLPLGAMCLSHFKISKVLIHQQRYRSATLTSSSQSQITITEEIQNKRLTNGVWAQPELKSAKASKRLQLAFRRHKTVKLLVVITTTFFILWTPFVVTRLFKHYGIHVNEILWVGTQLFMLTSVAVNCIIYASMSPAFKAAFKTLFTRVSTKRKDVWVTTGISKSMDISETYPCEQ